MPTYDYICNKCGHTFELFQSMTETPRKTCPVCKRVVRRGFYSTDYKNDKKPPKDKKETKKKEPSKTVKKAKD